MAFATANSCRPYLLFTVLALWTCPFWTGCRNGSQGLQAGKNHPLVKVMDGFHLYSYYAGGAFMAAEFVNAGCKNLALSAAYSDQELAAVLEPTRMAAKEYKVSIYVETDLLITKLFPPAVADGKTVILMAHSDAILDAYFALKEYRRKATEEGRLSEVEEEIAWKFGKLLSYSDAKIRELLAQQRNP